MSFRIQINTSKLKSKMNTLVTKAMLIGSEATEELAEIIKEDAVNLAPMSTPQDANIRSTFLNSVKRSKKPAHQVFKRLQGQGKLFGDHGALRRSARVDLTNKTDKSVTYTVSFDPTREGKQYNYALIQHENLAFNHTIGEAKFLEKAVVMNRNKLYDILKERLRGK